jgi:hypothetical protein
MADSLSELKELGDAVLQARAEYERLSLALGAMSSGEEGSAERDAYLVALEQRGDAEDAWHDAHVRYNQARLKEYARRLDADRESPWDPIADPDRWDP